jgi:hypothetical protein
MGCADDDCDGTYIEQIDHCTSDGDRKSPPKGPVAGPRLYVVAAGTTEPVSVRGSDAGSGVELDEPVAVELSQDAAIAYVADRDRILSVRVADGKTELVSGGSRGAGPDLDHPVGLEWDGGSGRLLVHDEGLDAVLAVDVVTGDRFLTLLPFSPASAAEERRDVDDASGDEYVVVKGN